jgi:4'-phosphopantetheinyl transferase
MSDDPPTIHFRECTSAWREQWLLPLSAAERDRADRFQCDADRRRFVAARHLLRTTLAARLGLDPESMPIAIGPLGKPQVIGAPDFSISHSGDYVALTIAPAGGVTIGIDIERVREDLDYQALARQVFATEERAALAIAADRPARFFALWTLKEAILKASGLGLSTDPRALCLDTDHDPPAVIRAPAGYRPDHCSNVDAPSGYAAAIAWRRSAAWSGRQDSNLRHPAPKAGALPDCATPRRMRALGFLRAGRKHLVGPAGLEPAT